MSAVLVAAAGRRDLHIGLLCIVLIVAIWSGFHILARFSARAHINAADLTAIRFTISGLLTLPWLLRNGFGDVGLARSLALAATGGIGFSFLAFAGFMFAPANHGAVLLSGSLPLFTSIAAWLLIGETFGPMKRLGLALIVGGIALIGVESFASTGLGTWRGDLCFLGGAVFWALFTVACRSWRVLPPQAVVLVCTVSMLAYMPVYLAVATPGFASVPLPELLAQVGYQGFIATICTLFLYTRAVATLGAATTTMMTAAVPGIVTLSASPLLGEVPSPLALAGVAVVTLGIIATVLTLRPAPVKP